MTIYTIDNPLSDDGRNKINNNFEELKKDINNAVDTISNKAFYQVVDSAKINWKEPVDSLANLPSSASEGDTRMTRNTGKVWRYDGQLWREIQQIDAGPVNEVDSRLTAELATTFNDVNNLKIQSNKLDYKSVSVTTKPTYLIQDDTIDHLKNVGANAALIIMCNITNATDSNITAMSDSVVRSQIQKLINSGVLIDILKPHIGLLDFSDTFSRDGYNPSDYNLAFVNWKAILLKYAEMCNEYGIPVLSVSCEQNKMEVNQYADKWKDIYDSIKALYPSLKIVHARRIDAFLSDNDEIYNYCDLIGINAYLNYTYLDYDGSNITVSDIADGFYYDYLGKQLIPRMQELSRKFNKGIYITEIGIMPRIDGLVSGVSYGEENYDIQRIFYEAVFSVLCNLTIVRGVSIWHADQPFHFWNNVEETPGEKTVKKYFKGGIL
ncbi:MAG: hypothetical protein ABTA16_00705 [Niallia sp.]